MINSQHEIFKDWIIYANEEWTRSSNVAAKQHEQYLFLNCRNVALAEKGLLAECLFDYKQEDCKVFI